MTAPEAAGAGVVVLGHRGASGLAPENTLPALRRALELDADGVEVDVQRTADGVLVLVHDDDWGRTTGNASPVRTTPWADVRRFDAGRWFGADYRGVPPATLDEALALARPGFLVNLELKSPERDPGLGDAVAAAVRRHRAEPHVLLTSFDPACIDALADTAPDLALGYLATRPVERMHPRVRTLALAAELVLSAPNLVPAAHARGLRVLVWTVDDTGAALRLASCGVDGIITNHPERLRSRFPRLRGTSS